MESQPTVLSISTSIIHPDYGVFDYSIFLASAICSRSFAEVVQKLSQIKSVYCLHHCLHSTARLDYGPGLIAVENFKTMKNLRASLTKSFHKN